MFAFHYIFLGYVTCQWTIRIRVRCQAFKTRQTDTRLGSSRETRPRRRSKASDGGTPACPFHPDLSWGRSAGNTVSNLIMIIPPIFGAIQTFRDGMEVRYVFAFLGLAAVGVGSWCFHMTLQYEMQLLDELPMIYSCCVFVYCLYECFKQENTVHHLVIVILFMFSVIVTVVYLQWKEPVFHQVMYGILVGCLVLRSVFIVTWVYPWLQPLAYTSLTVFLMGFLLWNIDNIFCDTLRDARRKLPPIVGAVTQFHAWWHILTGLGSYLHILFSLQTRTTYLRHRPKVKFICGLWPVVHVETDKAL
ncbi:alkaline ceramidase 3-like isoform X1 [Scleropages formosus]|uniref:alkaline ceramidase 3-like isoform X1 n=2 Tax=Scleropages formosus TaxID=113540 RepID=UPI0010FA8D76|nr:alkaline ceramidase 3 isoform X1 [Scleropages formosus]